LSVPAKTTARLTMRAWSLDDAHALCRILAEKDVLRYFPDPNPPDHPRVERFISAQLRHWDDHGYGWWALEPRVERELIGWCGLQYLPDTDETEVAFLLSRRYWGRGLASEAARESLRFGFGERGLERIVAIVHPENVASQRVIEKLGMSFVDKSEYFGMEVYRYALESSSFRPGI